MSLIDPKSKLAFETLAVHAGREELEALPSNIFWLRTSCDANQTTTSSNFPLLADPKNPSTNRVT